MAEHSDVDEGMVPHSSPATLAMAREFRAEDSSGGSSSSPAPMADEVSFVAGPMATAIALLLPIAAFKASTTESLALNTC